MDDELMNWALEQARVALRSGELPIGAVVTLEGNVIAQAHTRAFETGRLLTHADLLVLSEADGLGFSFDERVRLSLYVNLEPCIMCLGAAMSMGIGKIVYGLESPVDGGVGLLSGLSDSEERFPGYRLPELSGGVEAQVTRQLLEEFLAIRQVADRYAVWARGLLQR